MLDRSNLDMSLMIVTWSLDIHWGWCLGVVSLSQTLRCCTCSRSSAKRHRGRIHVGSRLLAGRERRRPGGTAPSRRQYAASFVRAGHGLLHLGCHLPSQWQTRHGWGTCRDVTYESNGFWNCRPCMSICFHMYTTWRYVRRSRLTTRDMPHVLLHTIDAVSVASYASRPNWTMGSLVSKRFLA